MGCDCAERAKIIRMWVEKDCVIVNNTGVTYSGVIPYIGVYNITPGRHELKNALLGAKIVRYFNNLFPDALNLEVEGDGSSIPYTT